MEHSDQPGTSPHLQTTRPASSWSGTPGRRFARLVVVIALLGGLVNLAAGLVFLDELAPLAPSSSGHLGVLLSEGQEHAAERYQIYGDLRDVAAGAVIIVPKELLDTYELMHLSQLDVERSTKSRRVPERLLDAIADRVVRSGSTEPTVGTTDDLRRYVIAFQAAAPSNVEVFVTRRSGTIVVLDAQLAREATNR